MIERSSSNAEKNKITPSRAFMNEMKSLKKMLQEPRLAPYLIFRILSKIEAFKNQLSERQKEQYKKVKKEVVKRVFNYAIKGIEADLNKNSLSFHIKWINVIFNELSAEDKVHFLLLMNRCEDLLKKKMNILNITFTHNLTFKQFFNKRWDLIHSLKSYKNTAKQISKNYKNEQMLFADLKTHETKKTFEKFNFLAKKELDRIKANKDYKAINNFFVYLKAGNEFFEIVELASWKEFEEIQNDLILYTSKIPLKDLKIHLDDVGQRITRNRKLRWEMPDFLSKRLQALNGKGILVENGKYYLDIITRGQKRRFEITAPKCEKGDSESYLPFIKLVLTLRGQEYQIYSIIEASEFFTKTNLLNIVLIQNKLEKAVQDYEVQEKNKNALENFDLQKKNKIGYICLIPKSPDKTSDGVLEFITHMPNILRSKGYKLDLSAMNGKPYVEIKDAHTFIKEKVAELYKKGIRHFYLDLNGHGVPAGIAIGGDPQKLFSGNDLVSLLKQYQDCEFTITSVACHGGGLRPALQSYIQSSQGKEHGKKINIFLQTKPDTSNLAANLKVAPGEEKELYSTVYNVLFARFLLEGLTYGQAHYRADVETQKIGLTNPEAILKGVLVTEKERTRGNETKTVV